MKNKGLLKKKTLKKLKSTFPIKTKKNVQAAAQIMQENPLKK